MNDKCKKALEYVKAHKREIVIGTEIFTLGLLLGAGYTAMKDSKVFKECDELLDSLNDTLENSVIIRDSNEKAMQLYRNFFAHNGIHVMTGINVTNVNDVADHFEELRKIAPGLKYNVLMEAVKNDK